MNSVPDPLRGKEIFEQIVDLASSEERQRFLQAACGDNTGLLVHVKELLQAFNQAEAEGFLTEHAHARLAGAGSGTQPQVPGAPGGEGRLTSQPQLPAEETITSNDGVERVGDRLGRYRLLEKMGEGGCGVVYRAEQLEPVRRLVALKVVKLGMDTNRIIARFEAERQALAVMDHANIAKVFDAGTTASGRPYFVMELSRGVLITQFCNEQRLSLRERVELFIQVCSAIQHAHQKGIIHRDLKPSNILVTLNDGVPVPKVIDFGLAKATQGVSTENQTLFTLLEPFLGTPTYMSPEQAEMRGVDVDTRSDIYSLGVVLYELLTGRPPFDGKALLARGVEELIFTLHEVEPPRPSTLLGNLVAAELQTVARSRRCAAARLIHSLRGDLDSIVMKCLEKDRARRYETANGLAADLRRHLADEPVVACPPSRTYRLHKALRRNRLVITAVGAVLTALMLGLGLAMYGLVRARAERDLADEAHIATQAQKSIAEEQRRVSEAGARAAGQELENTRKALAHAQSALAEADQQTDGPPMRGVLLAEPTDLHDLPSGRGIEEVGITLKPVLMLDFSPSGQRLISVGPAFTRVWQPTQLPPASD